VIRQLIREYGLLALIADVIALAFFMAAGLALVVIAWAVMA
jgi:hypothetical protein